MKTVKINKVRLIVDNHVETSMRKLKPAMIKAAERDIKISSNVKTSFLDRKGTTEVITVVDLMMHVGGIHAPIRKSITIISLEEKGRTGIDSILEKVDKFISELSDAVLLTELLKKFDVTA